MIALAQLQAYPFPILHVCLAVKVEDVDSWVGITARVIAQHKWVGATCFSMTPKDQTGNRTRNSTVYVIILSWQKNIRYCAHKIFMKKLRFSFLHEFSASNFCRPPSFRKLKQIGHSINLSPIATSRASEQLYQIS